MTPATIAEPAPAPAEPPARQRGTVTDIVAALKAARRRELAEHERRTREAAERAEEERRSRFMTAVVAALDQLDSAWLAPYWKGDSLAAGFHTTREVAHVPFHLPGHRPVYLVLLAHSCGWGSAHVFNSIRTWRTTPAGDHDQGHDDLADALIAAEITPPDPDAIPF